MYFIFAESDSTWDFLSKPRSSGSGAAVLLEKGLVLFMVKFPPVRLPSFRGLFWMLKRR